MALYIVSGHKESDGPVTPPAPTVYAMYFEAGAKVAFADTYSELISALIPGYDAVTAELQAALRGSLARTLAPLVQANALDPELPEVTQGTMLDLHASVLAGTASTRALQQWRESGPVAPLVRVCDQTDAHSHDADEDVDWQMCPRDDRSLAMSLHTYGIVKLMRRDGS